MDIAGPEDCGSSVRKSMYTVQFFIVCVWINSFIIRLQQYAHSDWLFSCNDQTTNVA